MLRWVFLPLDKRKVLEWKQFPPWGRFVSTIEYVETEDKVKSRSSAPSKLTGLARGAAGAAAAAQHWHFHTSHWNTAALSTPHTPTQHSHVNHILHYQFNTTPLAPSPIQHSQPRNTVATIYSKYEPKGQRLSSSSGKHLQSTRCHLASRQPKWKNNHLSSSTPQSARDMELTFEDAPNKHVASGPTAGVGQPSQVDSGRLAVDWGLAVVPARQQPRPALCLWRGENNGTHHRSLPAQQTEKAGFVPPFIRPGGNRLAWGFWKERNKQPVFSLFGAIQAWRTCSIKTV